MHLLEHVKYANLDGEDNTWWTNSDTDCCQRKTAPVELLLLASLRILGRGCTFDDAQEMTRISAETIRYAYTVLKYRSYAMHNSVCSQ